MKNTIKYGIILVIGLVIGGLLLIPTFRLLFWLLGLMMKNPILTLIIVGIPTAGYMGYVIGSEKKSKKDLDITK